MNIPYEEILPQEEEARFMFNHGRVLGSVFHIVQTTGDGTIMRVIPTACEGVIPFGTREIVWANIYWQHQTASWVCVIYNTKDDDQIRWSLGLGLHSKHKSLPSALRKARKAVGANAPKAEAGWKNRIQIDGLESVYPSESEYQYAKWFWNSIDVFEAQHDQPDYEPYDEGYDPYWE